VTDNGVAQLNDFGMSQLMDVRGFTTKIMRNIRFSAPELMPITEQKSDIHPTFQTDIFGLAMLLLQVCLYFDHALMPILIEVFATLSFFTDLTEICRADCHIIMSVTAMAMTMISDLCAASMMGKDPYGIVIAPCMTNTGRSCVIAGMGIQTRVQISRTS
jgi:hypothetical protein